jgi:hypothetical protein
MNELPNFEDFHARLSDVFLVELADSSPYPLTLIEASALPPTGARSGRSHPFQIKFRGPGPGYLPQQTHALQNETLGLLEIFLVPLGQRDGEFLYQAVFN